MGVSAEEAIEAISAQVAAAMTRYDVPGVAVGLFHQGQERYASLGLTSVDHPLTVDNDTLFQIGSTTKTLTATVIMCLVEQGKVGLDEPVRRYVPELSLADPEVAERITLRHLLTHTGGHDGDLFDDFGSGDDALSRACAGMAVLSQLAPLGQVWSYSNAGFSLAGRLIEAATGMTFEQACMELVLDPLGMTRSFFSAADCISHRVAVGHRAGAEGVRITRPWALSRAVNPAGGLVSSVADQMRYARFHLGDGRTPGGDRLLKAETLRYMQSPLVTAGGGRAAAVGLSWLLQPTPGVIAHGGETNGQSSAFVIVPDRGFAITVLTNADAGAAVHTPVIKWALREVCGVTPPRSKTSPAAPSSVSTLPGRYSCRVEDIEVARSGDHLTLGLRPTKVTREAFPDAPTVPPARIEVYDDGGFKIVDGPLVGTRGEFLSDRDGRPGWLRTLGRIHVRAALAPDLVKDGS